MNFVLIHFLAKVVIGITLAALHILWCYIQQKGDLKSKKQSSTRATIETMDSIEGKYPAKSCKGLQLRKSYSNIFDGQDVQQQTIGSVEMSRSGSNQSTVTDSTDASKGSLLEEKSNIPGQPANFGMIVPGVYRSSYPKEADFDFIKSLNLRTIITLVDKEGPETFAPFMKSNGIQHHVLLLESTKKQAVPIETISSILKMVHDEKNHPVLIHCNQGRHRTGCVVAITRKLQQWSNENILNEYKTFAAPKIRDCDIEYISKFEIADIDHLGLVPLVETLPGETIMLTQPGRHRPLPGRNWAMALCLMLMFFSIFCLVSSPKGDGHRGSSLKY